MLNGIAHDASYSEERVNPDLGKKIYIYIYIKKEMVKIGVRVREEWKWDERRRNAPMGMPDDFHRLDLIN